jgi:hypothetical protein
MTAEAWVLFALLMMVVFALRLHLNRDEHRNK